MLSTARVAYGVRVPRQRAGAWPAESQGSRKAVATRRSEKKAHGAETN
jgi:hypothetical protein